MSQRDPQSQASIEAAAGQLEQKYSVIAQLGQGGMSVVYLGTSRGIGNVQKLVVLKSIKPELLSNDKVREMFMDEARLAIRLTHPNIVQTYELAMIDRRPVLVMEYMEGQPLSNVLRTCGVEGLPLAMRLHILAEALNGLDHAHNVSDYDGRPLGLVHRDVSPQNIFITYDGHVKILDFGIAKALDRSAQTEFGEIKGKIRYMAPEQMQGAVDLDRRADVFAMGIMLWEFLTHRRMWQDAKDVEVMTFVISKDMPSPRKYAPEISPRLEAICMKAIQRDPAARYESCAAMQADLERAMVELGLRTSGRELGRLVQEQFTDVRTGIRRAIDTKLKEGDSAPIDLRVDEQGLLIVDLLLPQSRRPYGSATPSAASITEAVPPKKSRWPYALLALLLLGGAAYGAVAYPQYVHLPGKEPPTAAPAPRAASPAAAPSAAPAPESATVPVNLRSSPADAKLLLDGVELPHNPFVRNLPSDGSRHELSAVAPGYETKSKLVFLSGTEPIDVEIVLDKSKVEQAPKSVGKRPAHKPKSPAGTAPAGPDCSYPFYVDEAGIRRVRRECM